MANTSLLKPTSVEVALSENNPNRAVITLEPFERGYGHTLGNALRRILLSSMIGFAPTEVQITGIVHEYSQIDGVLEDVVDILLNLKGVVFKLDGRDEVTVMLRKDGEGVVTAADFDLPHDVSVVNPDHVIAHLSGGRLEMQVKIEKGRGYQPGDVRAFRDDYSKAAIGRMGGTDDWLPDPPRCLSGSGRPRGPAHRPRQARDDDRDQRRHRSRRRPS